VLSRAEIVAAALRIVSAGGVEALSMRRLADDLGTAPMSLYRHVSDKQDLLLACLEEVAAGLEPPAGRGAPRDRIVAAFTLVHDVLDRHRWVVSVLAAGELAAPRARIVVEEVLSAAYEAGLSERDAAVAYSALWQFTLGHLLSDHPAGREDDTLLRRIMLDGIEEFPALARTAPYFEALDHAERFRSGLVALVEGLLLRAAGS
jgi:AcrR family transcriptional regulator